MTAKQNQGAFRILDLPAELREYIIELALFTDTEHFYGASSKTKWIDGGGHKPPPLLQTCNQIREESGTLYYRQTSFMFDDRKQCALWLDSVGPQFRDQIKWLSYCTGLVGDDTFIGTPEQRWRDLQLYLSSWKGFDVSGMLRVCNNRQSHATDDWHIWVSCGDEAQTTLT